MGELLARAAGDGARGVVGCGEDEAARIALKAAATPGASRGGIVEGNHPWSVAPLRHGARDQQGQ